MDRSRLRLKAQFWVRRQLARNALGRRWVANAIRKEHPALKDWIRGTEPHPPADQKILTPAIWIWDVYGPAHASGLKQWLERLKNPDSIRRHQDLKSRRRLNSWSYGRLPTLYSDRRPTPRSRSTDHVRLPLPSGVAVAFPTLHELPGGLVVLTIGLVYGDGDGDELDQLLRTPVESRIRPHRSGRGHSRTPAEAVQKEAVDDFFRSRVDDAATWLAKLAPGALGERSEAPERRAGRLVAFAQEVPAASNAERHGWRSAIGFQEWRQWRSTAAPVALDEVKGFGPQLSGVSAALRVSTYHRGGAEHEYEMEWAGAVSELDGAAGPLWLVSALSDVLGMYVGMLSDLRDSPYPQKSNPWAAGKRLGSFRRELQVMVEARTVAQQLGSKSLHDFLAMAYQGSEFEETNVRPGQANPSLAISGTFQRLRKDAEKVVELEETVRSRLTLESQMLATSASIGGQRLSIALATLALLVAASSLVVGLTKHPAPPPQPVSPTPTPAHSR